MPELSQRAQAIRKYLVEKMPHCVGASEWGLDWLAAEIERDEQDGLLIWDEPKKKKSNSPVRNAPPTL